MEPVVVIVMEPGGCNSNGARVVVIVMEPGGCNSNGASGCNSNGASGCNSNGAVVVIVMEPVGGAGW